MRSLDVSKQHRNASQVQLCRADDQAAHRMNSQWIRNSIHKFSQRKWGVVLKVFGADTCWIVGEKWEAQGTR